MEKNIFATRTKIPYKCETKLCYHTTVNKGKLTKGIPNLILHKDGHKYRVRSELLLFNGDKLYLVKTGKKNQYGVTYILPGGGIDDQKETIEESAARECMEEAHFLPKNVTYTGITVSKLYPMIPEWHKTTLWLDGIIYDGDMTFICTGEFDRHYTGYVKKVDQQSGFSAGKFYTYDEVKGILSLEHKKIFKAHLTQMAHESYTMESSTSNNKIHEKIKDFLSWMNKNIEYGKLVNGTVYTDTSDFSDYRTISPENFKRFKTGVCWDYTEYEAWYFKNVFHMKQVTTVPKHMEFALYYCQFTDVKKNMPTHTWLVYNLNGSLYTFESSWYTYRGIRKFSSEKEMLDNYINAQIETHLKQRNPVKNPVVFRYDSHKQYNLDPETYMRGMYEYGKKVSLESFKPQTESVHIEDLTDKSINKYDYPGLKHLRIDANHKGKIIIDSSGNKVVGFINMNTDRKDIQALEINKEYRRSGYATKLLDVAKSMGAKTLWVRDTNIDAQKLYAKTGWKKTGKTQGRMIEMSCESFESGMESFMVEHGVKPDSHDAMSIICENMFDDKDKRTTNKYAMEPSMEALLDKSDALQNIVFSGKDLYCNYNKFGKEYNVCFVIGYSGSGKSVLSDKLAKKHKATHIDLDIFTFFAMKHSFDDPEIAGYAGGILTKYIKEMNKPADLFLGKKIRTDMQFIMKETNEFVRWLVSRKSKKELFIVDGVQCSWVLSSNPEYNTYPVIFKGTSLLTSTLRAAKRSGQALSIPYIINGLMERYSGRSLIEYPKQFILPSASSIKYKDESVEPTTEGALDKTIKLYHGSTERIKSEYIEPISISMGNAIEDPQWAVFLWEEDIWAWAWALYRMLIDEAIKAYKSNLVAICPTNEMLYIYIDHSYYEKLFNRIKGKYVYVYEVKVPYRDLGIGQTSYLPELTCYNRAKIIKRNYEIVTKEMYSAICVPVDITEYKIEGGRVKLGTNVANPREELSTLMKKEKNLFQKRNKIYREYVYTGKLKPGDPITRDMYEGYKSSEKIDNMVIERSENMETNKQPTEQDKRRAIQKALSIVKKIIAKLPVDYRDCFEQMHDLAEMKEFLSGESHRIELYRWTVYPYANKVKESPRTSDFLDKFGRECLNPCYDMIDKEKDSIPGFTFDYSGDWDEGSIELELKNPPPVVKKPKPKAKRVTKPSKKVDSKLLTLWRSL